MQCSGGRSGGIAIPGLPFSPLISMEATLKLPPHWLQILLPRHLASSTSSLSFKLTTSSISVTPSSISCHIRQIDDEQKNYKMQHDMNSSHYCSMTNIVPPSETYQTCYLKTRGLLGSANVFFFFLTEHGLARKLIKLSPNSQMSNLRTIRSWVENHQDYKGKTYFSIKSYLFIFLKLNLVLYLLQFLTQKIKYMAPWGMDN